MQRNRRYAIYDVFSRERLAGNPLAIVFDAEDLSDAGMQRIAAEFNLSETVFVLPAAEPAHKARIRIFTPHYEMPFAGHPTVGSAVALAGEGGSPGLFVLEETIGPVRCAVRDDEGLAFAEFDLPQLPRRVDLSADPVAVGAALGLGPHEIGFENHQVSAWSAGVPYVTVPVSGLEAAAKVRLDIGAWFDLAPRKGVDAVASAYVYCRETIGHANAFHARMFVAGHPPYEDPATGSAAAAFAGTVVHFDDLREGAHSLWIEQGLEMGRPSRIRLELDVASGGALQRVRIGGNAVKTAEGVLLE